MTSDATRPREAFVWIWLPGKTTPVVAGRVHAEDDHFVFTYGRSYLARDDAIPIYTPELPLRAGAIVPEPPLEIANALRDASPDTWGRRVIAHRLAGGRGGANGTADLDELTSMLQSGSDRTGALDFQASPRDYVPREADNETLERLVGSADRVDRGLPLAPDLAEALQHGTAIGGARPKALIRDGDIKYVAKFSSSTDTFSIVKAEFIAMRLASLAGLNVAPVKLVRAMNKDVPADPALRPGASRERVDAPRHGFSVNPARPRRALRRPRVLRRSRRHCPGALHCAGRDPWRSSSRA